MTYTVQVTGVENATEEVTNSASLEGITKQPVTKTDYVKITGAGATVSGQKQIVRLKKSVHIRVVLDLLEFLVQHLNYLKLKI